MREGERETLVQGWMWTKEEVGRRVGRGGSMAWRKSPALSEPQLTHLTSGSHCEGSGSVCGTKISLFLAHASSWAWPPCCWSGWLGRFTGRCQTGLGVAALAR